MRQLKHLPLGVALLLLASGSTFLQASSHMDAPLITFDDPANTTDVYAFRSSNDGVEYLTTALAVYPFEEPGIGPNKYNFDDNVLYEIHVALGDDVAAGRKTISYRFRFDTTYKNDQTILQSYTCGVMAVDDACQNLTQTYTVNKWDRRTGAMTSLGTMSGEPLIVPPNNQGLVTPKYNQGDDGEMPAKEGVDSASDLDDYTSASVYEVGAGPYRVFAGQRDDGFYADIQSIFDVDLTFGGPNKPFDSQGGFNVHTIVLDIPLSVIGGGEQIVGVYATTSRPRLTILRSLASNVPVRSADFAQVARQGNPLFCEALIAIEDKDLYSRTNPTQDAALFGKYASSVELAAVVSATLGLSPPITPDLSAIFIPDMIRVDLSTPAARLAGGGSNPSMGVMADDAGFSRLSLFGGDVLPSSFGNILGGDTAFGGFPNGRRFGDDVVDIAVLAVLALGGVDVSGVDDIDRVTSNDISYNKVFPYAGTPLNGRNHKHH